MKVNRPVEDATVTSSGSTAISTPHGSYSVHYAPLDQTIGGSLYARYLPMSQAVQLTTEVHAALLNNPDKQIVSNAENLLQQIENAVEGIGLAGYDIRNLPRLRVLSAEDNSVVFEWASPKFRVGISVEQDPSDSGWYVVSSKDLHQIGASGHLASTDTQRLLPWLLGFVAKNS